MKVVLDKGAFMPERAHKTDAGLDLKTPVNFTLPRGNSIVINTGVHVELPPGTVGMLKSKSGLNVRHGITSEGVIDEGYTGSIRAKLYNHGTGTVEFKAGDKITQLVVMPVITPDIEIVDSLEETERGANGFGSTGK
jgi:dUTP pyrophosphatase